jgi:hypothetical protein
MELSGNLKKQTVSVGKATPRNFTVSLQGNGLLTNVGFCGIATWRVFVTNKVTGASGTGFCDGACDTTSIFLLVSDGICILQLYDRERRFQFLCGSVGSLMIMRNIHAKYK